MKMALSWVVGPCRLVDVYQWYLMVLNACIIALMMEAASTSKTSVKFYHGATSNETATFILPA
jgi:hypothetical protein